MNVYLIRHAHAGIRHDDDPHDKYRQLSDKGWARAHQLVSLFAGVEIASVLSSPATRCMQTVQPLAEARDLKIVEHDDLWEGSDIDDVLALLEKHAERILNGSNPSLILLACSHGDIIPELLHELSRSIPVKGHGCEKGSIWVLRYTKDGWKSAQKISKKAEELPPTT